jgi:anthranilate synthase component 2
MKILVIDNYDSFVYNLVQYVGELGKEQNAELVVARNDKITADDAKKIAPDRIIISPGPGNPKEKKYFGVCAELLKTLSTTIPTLGVCLGMQGFVYTYGGNIIHAKKLMHGKTSEIAHDGKGIFAEIPNPVEVGRYHSLAVDAEQMPDCLEITARTIDDREIMGVRHKNYPIEGVQFHPESILTPYGKKMIGNFLNGA